MGIGESIGAIANYFGAQESSSAIQEGAQSEAAAIKYGIDAQLQMWEQAQSDFAPYLNAGYNGLNQLQNAIPEYTNNVLAPLYQQYTGYNLTDLPNPNAYTINPVTGQVNAATSTIGSAGVTTSNTTPYLQSMGSNTTNYAPTGRVSNLSAVNNTGTTTSAASNAGTTGANYTTLPVQSSTLPLLRSASGSTGTTSSGIPYYTTPTGALRIGTDSTSSALNPNWYSNAVQDVSNASGTVTDAVANAIAAASPSFGTTLNNISAFYPSSTSQTNAQLAGANTTMGTTLATADELAQGGVLSPTVPTLNQALDYTFNENDPTYQILLQQKNSEVDKFLAKQGLLGSSAGEAFRQKQLDTLRAAQDETQYNRALTERNYNTQTAMDQYNLEQARGETLYNRLYGQASDLYSRTANTATTNDTRNLALLAQNYSAGTDIYNTLYNQANNLANLGYGATSSQSNLGYQSGQGLANSYNQIGQAAGTAAAAQGNIWSNYISGLGSAAQSVDTQMMGYLASMYGGGGYY